MNLVERIREQTRNLTVCNDDLRHCTDPEVRDYIHRLRALRHEGMWHVGKRWGRSADAAAYLIYDADWAAHRLALAVGIDKPLRRDQENQDIDPVDVHTLLTYLRAVQEGRPPTRMEQPE